MHTYIKAAKPSKVRFGQIIWSIDRVNPFLTIGAFPPHMRNPKGNIAFTLVVATILYLPQTGCYVGWQQLLSQLVTSSLSLKLIIIVKSCCVYGFGAALLQSIVQCNLTSDFGAAFTLKHCAMYFF